MAAAAAINILPPHINAANLPPQVLAELTNIYSDNGWAIHIRTNGQPNRHPRSWDPNPPNGLPPPTQPITPVGVVFQLQKIGAQSRWYLRRTGYFGYLHPTTRELIGTTILQHRQIKFFINTVLDHLQKYHLHHGNTFATKDKCIALRHLYYLWDKKFQNAYGSNTELAFRRNFNLFLRIVNLPMCALRIVSCRKGEFCMPAKIVRGTDEEDCMHFYRQIGEEWACRLYGVAVPEYSDPLTIVPFEVPGSTNNESFEVSHTLLVEKKCIFHNFFFHNFHMKSNCVIMTGSGFPDTDSRAFAKFMELYVGHQVQGLCDNNPCGVLLLKSYQHTRDEIAPHGMLKTDVGWLGWSPEFGSTFPQVHQTAGYTITDDRALNHLLNPGNQFVSAQGPKYANAARTTFRQDQLETMRQDRVKCNLDDIPTQPLHDAVKFIFDQGHQAYEGLF